MNVQSVVWCLAKSVPRVRSRNVRVMIAMHGYVAVTVIVVTIVRSRRRRWRRVSGARRIRVVTKGALPLLIWCRDLGVDCEIKEKWRYCACNQPCNPATAALNHTIGRSSKFLSIRRKPVKTNMGFYNMKVQIFWIVNMFHIMSNHPLKCLVFGATLGTFIYMHSPHSQVKQYTYNIAIYLLLQGLKGNLLSFM